MAMKIDLVKQMANIFQSNEHYPITSNTGFLTLKAQSILDPHSWPDFNGQVKGPVTSRLTWYRSIPAILCLPSNNLYPPLAAYSVTWFEAMPIDTIINPLGLDSHTLRSKNAFYDASQ